MACGSLPARVVIARRDGAIGLDSARGSDGWFSALTTRGGRLAHGGWRVSPVKGIRNFPRDGNRRFPSGSRFGLFRPDEAGPSQREAILS